MQCDRCGRPAVTFIRYNGSHLCADHFREYVEKRVKREMRKQVHLKSGDTVGVAVSGGKESMNTLSIMDSVFSNRNGISIVAIAIDEGINGYRPPSLDIVRRFCSDRDIEYRERAFSEISGLTMDKIAPVAGESSPCTYCGVFRRKLMNDEARKLGARYLATGHNLDDMAQSIMMDFVRGDAERMARLGPHSKVKEGLIPRFMPLRMIPEKESLLYAIVSGIPFWDGECPYWKEALRNQYRNIVDDLESRSPGTRFSILSSYDKLRPMMEADSPGWKMHRCACGEPANSDRCMACRYEEMLLKRLE